LNDSWRGQAGVSHGIGGVAFAKSLDESLQEYLSRAGVEWDRLPNRERVEAEVAWRQVYGHAFQGRPRLRHGARAEHEYRSQSCDYYRIVPFSAGVSGLPVHVYRQAIAAYECHGSLAALGTFCDAEFFISPPDMKWVMIHTHEDYAFGGPYFIRADWIPGGGRSLG
jgi:hypothetical protein